MHKSAITISNQSNSTKDTDHLGDNWIRIFLDYTFLVTQWRTEDSLVVNMQKYDHDYGITKYDLNTYNTIVSYIF